MARKQATSVRKVSHQPPRLTPYALPYRGTSVSHAPNEASLKLWSESREVHQEVLRSQTLSPETSYSNTNSNGPRTPESTTLSPQASPYRAPLPTLESQHYRLPYSADTPCTDDTAGFVYIEQDRESDIFGAASPPYTSWSDQSQSFSICKSCLCVFKAITYDQSLSATITRFLRSHRWLLEQKWTTVGPRDIVKA